MCWIGEIAIEYVSGISLTQSGAIKRNALLVVNERDAIDAPTLILSDDHPQALFLQSLLKFFLRLRRGTHCLQNLVSDSRYQWLDSLFRLLHPVLYGSIAHTTSNVRGVDRAAYLVSLIICWDIDKSFIFLSPKLCLNFLHCKIVYGEDGIQFSK